MQLGTSTAVQHSVYHGLSSVQSCAMRPPASLSSQVETTLLRRLATLKIQLQLGASCLISCSHAFFGSATLCCKTQTRLVKPTASSISRNSTSRQCQPATGNEALRVLGLQVPGILAWLRTTNCAGGSPGKLQDVVRSYCLTLSWPSRVSDSQCGLSSYLHMKSAARKRTKQLGPSTAVQHAVYHGLSSAQSCDSCALKPPASLSSQVESK